MGSIKRPPMYRIPLSQLVVLALICAAALFVDLPLAYSLALGGLIHILPNLYFVVHVRFQGARQMPQSLRALKKGEIGKLLLSMAGFAVVFVMVKPLNVLAMFIAYAVMVLVQFVVLLRINAFSVK